MRFNVSGFFLFWFVLAWPALGQDGENKVRIDYDEADLQSVSHSLATFPKIALATSTSRPTIKLLNAEYVEFEDTDTAGNFALALRGNVKLLVSDPDNNNDHLIQADEIVYNRADNLLAARGEVEYTVIYDTGGSQSISAASLIFDLLDSNAVFVDGTIQYHHLSRNRSLDFELAGGTIAWLKDRTMLVDNAVITSSLNLKNPNYELHARRMWLLGLSDWALRDVTLLVGRVPLFYLPYFFLPGDELLFNPVVGMKEREGLYLNTTLYLFEDQLGDMVLPASESNTEDSNRRPILFVDKLTNSNQHKNDSYIKFMFDLYTRLGLFTGLGAKFPLGNTGTIQFELGLARSREIWRNGRTFLSYDKKTGRSLWHESSLFGATLPLRYSFKLKGSVVRPNTSIVANVEFFSDVKFVRDFLHRNEDINFKLPSEGVEGEEEGENLSNLIWQLQVKSDLLPLISNLKGQSGLLERLKIDNAAVRWFWHSRELSAGSNESSAGSFYYPAFLHIPVVGNIGGTLFNLPVKMSRNVVAGSNQYQLTGKDKRFGIFPYQVTPSKPTVEQFNSLFRSLRVRRPQLSSPEPLVANMGLPLPPVLVAAELNYDVRPGIILEAIHDSSDWLSADDIDYSLQSVTTHFTNIASLRHSLDLYGGFLGLSNALQHGIAIKRLVGPDSALNDTNFERQIRGNSRSTLSLSNQVFFRPLLYNSLFYNSAVVYDLDLQIFSTFPDDSVDDFQIQWGSWDAQGVTKHKLQTVLALRRDSWQQSLGISVDLPPRPLLFNADLSLEVGIASASADLDLGCKISELTLWTCNLWEIKPLRVNFRVASFDGLSIEHELRIDLRNPNIERVTSSFQLGGLNTSLTAIAMGPMQRLSLRQLKLDYEQKVGPVYFWRNRIRLEFTPHANWLIDFQDPTQNQFIFATAFTMGIHEFFDLSFSTVTRNDHTYRYVKPWAEREGEPTLNVLQDLWWSFTFWNEENRRISNFKIDRISLSVIHHLQDWDLSLEYALRPKVIDEGNIQLISQFSVFLQWISVPEIQSLIQG